MHCVRLEPILIELSLIKTSPEGLQSLQCKCILTSIIKIQWYYTLYLLSVFSLTRSLQLILKISTTYRLVSYLLMFRFTKIWQQNQYYHYLNWHYSFHKASQFPASPVTQKSILFSNNRNDNNKWNHWDNRCTRNHCLFKIPIQSSCQST